MTGYMCVSTSADGDILVDNTLLPWPDHAVDRRCADERPYLPTWIKTQLAPTLSPGDIVLHGNVGFHKSEKAEQLVEAKGPCLLFLPPCSPDLNPIGMAFLKLKALLRKPAARSFDTIAQAIGDIIALFSVNECRNVLKAAGYEAG